MLNQIGKKIIDVCVLSVFICFPVLCYCQTPTDLSLKMVTRTALSDNSTVLPGGFIEYKVEVGSSGTEIVELDLVSALPSHITATYFQRQCDGPNFCSDPALDCDWYPMPVETGVDAGWRIVLIPGICVAGYFKVNVGPNTPVGTKITIPYGAWYATGMGGDWIVNGPGNVEVTVVGPPLSQKISVNRHLVQTGDLLTYTVNFNNSSSDTLSNVICSVDVNNDRTSYVEGSSTGNGTYSEQNSQIIWNISSLAALTSGQFTYQVKVKDGLTSGTGLPLPSGSISADGQASVTAKSPGSASAVVDKQTENAVVTTNRHFERSFEPVGEPVSTNSGAYYFNMPLLNLGGPMDLDFTLFYRSDMNNRAIRVPNDFPSENRANPARFWWSPRYQAQTDEDGLCTVWMENSDMVVFKKQGDSWTLFQNAVEGQKENGQPIEYRLKETQDFLYFLNPIKRRVTGFEKIENGLARTAFVQDINGSNLTYAYTKADHTNPASVSDGLGRQLNFFYTTAESGESTLASISDHTGRTIGFFYDMGQDNDGALTLRSISNAMGQNTTFEYQAVKYMDLPFLDNISSRIFPSGNRPYTQKYTMIETDTLGLRVTSQADAKGNTINLAWASDGYVCTESRPDDSKVVHTYADHHGMPASWTDGMGNYVTMEQDEKSRLTKVFDRKGGVSSFTWHDPTGYPGTITNADNSVLSFTYTPRTRTVVNPANAEEVTFTVYDLTRMDYPDQTFEIFERDILGRVVRYTDQAGGLWEATYNSQGQILTATNPQGGVATATYNADGTVATVTDSNTGISSYEYDTARRPVGILGPDGSVFRMAYDVNDQVILFTANGETWGYSYDVNGNLVSESGPEGETNIYTYDALDRLVSAKGPEGETITYTYDSMGRVATEKGPDQVTSTFAYDKAGRLVSITRAGKTWQTTYDVEGLPVSFTTPLNRATTLVRDKLGRVKSLTDPRGRATAFARDAMGRVKAITDPLDRVTEYGRDNAGNLSSVNHPGGVTSSYQRNGLGLLTSLADPGGQTWKFASTNAGRPTGGTDPLERGWSTTLDNMGRPMLTAFADGASLSQTYDVWGRVSRRLYSDGGQEDFSYDDQGLLKETGCGDTFTRDKAGRITRVEHGPEGAKKTFGAAYDEAGRIKSVSYDNGAVTVLYSYDQQTGLLSRVEDDVSGSFVNFSYDVDKRLTGLIRSNNKNTIYDWDDTNRLARIQDGGLLDIKRTFDAAGRVTLETADLPLDPAPLLAQDRQEQTFDAASQNASAGFSHDARGRRTASPGKVFDYNDVGNLIKINDVELTYNDLGQVIGQSTGQRFYHHHALAGAPIAGIYEEGLSGFSKYFVWSPTGALLYMIDLQSGKPAFFFHYDTMGSTIALTDTNGAMTDSYAYSPYGRLLGHTGTSDQPFTFLGKWGVRRQKGAPDLYQAGVRYYDARTASFLTPEPLWPMTDQPQALNPYQYAYGDPANLMDINGKGIMLSDAWMFDPDLGEWQATQTTITPARKAPTGKVESRPVPLAPEVKDYGRRTGIVLSDAWMYDKNLGRWQATQECVRPKPPKKLVPKELSLFPGYPGAHHTVKTGPDIVLRHLGQNKIHGKLAKTLLKKMVSQGN